MKIVVATVLSLGASLALLVSPVIGQSKCTDVPEKIPHNAVEPVQVSGQQPYCPRADYEIKWYVVEDERTDGSGFISCGGNGGCGYSGKTRTVLVFKASCLPVDYSHSTVTAPYVITTPGTTFVPYKP